jgi:serine/threonine protein kinase
MDDFVDQIFGKHRLIHKLGVGDAAQVYLGENSIIPQIIKAIKVFSNLSAVAAGAFEQEARTLARLNHPHLLRIEDYGMSSKGIPYLVMPYQSNGNLRQEYPAGLVLSLETVVDFVKQLAEALTYLHTRVPPIIHGNLKPQNILIGRNYELLLSDFGSVMRLQQGNPPQRPPPSPITIAYAAPEQLPLSGNPHLLSTATDQYALSLLTYELLTNDWPFRGDEQAMSKQKLSDAPPALRTKRPDISPEVERVVLKALARDEHERYASVRDFTTALEQANMIQRDE